MSGQNRRFHLEMTLEECRREADEMGITLAEYLLLRILDTLENDIGR